MIKFSKWLASFVPIFYLYIYIYVTQQPLSILVPRPNCPSRHYKKKKRKKTTLRTSLSPSKLSRNESEFDLAFLPLEEIPVSNEIFTNSHVVSIPRHTQLTHTRRPLVEGVRIHSPPPSPRRVSINRRIYRDIYKSDKTRTTRKSSVEFSFVTSIRIPLRGREERRRFS